MCFITGVIFGYDVVATPDKTEKLTVTNKEISESNRRYGIRRINYDVTAVGGKRYTKSFNKKTFEKFQVGQQLEISVSKFLDEWMVIRIINVTGEKELITDKRPYIMSIFSIGFILVSMLIFMQREKLITNSYIQFVLAGC